ncbi:lipopolysaccharide heptosyltransferase II [bacterium]|nr:lipopolysaccharide heptosyltransferase II [candidate division CSSED10-310 bacterium]
MASAALQLLAESRPDLELDVVVKPWVRELFESDPRLRRVFVYHPAHGVARAGSAMVMISRLRRQAYSTALLFQNAFEAALLAAAAGIPDRIGYARDSRRFLLTRWLPPPVNAGDGIEHETWHYLRLLSLLDITPAACAPQIHVNPHARKRAAVFLRAAGHDHRPLLAVFPGAAYGPAKQWPARGFAGLIQAAEEEFGFHAILLGAASDQQACSTVIEAMEQGGSETINAAGFLSLGTTAALLSGCALCVANDSGGMHMAAALGVPTVGIFGPTDPRRTAPLGSHAGYVEAPVECRPCLKRRCDHHECMRAITVEQVMNRVRKVLHG